MVRVFHPDPDSDFYPTQIPDPGVEKASKEEQPALKKVFLRTTVGIHLDC